MGISRDSFVMISAARASQTGRTETVYLKESKTLVRLEVRCVKPMIDGLPEKILAKVSKLKPLEC
jgi:hypothetical protein